MPVRSSANVGAAAVSAQLAVGVTVRAVVPAGWVCVWYLSDSLPPPKVTTVPKLAPACSIPRKPLAWAPLDFPSGPLLACQTIRLSLVAT